MKDDWIIGCTYVKKIKILSLERGQLLLRVL